MSSNKRLIKFVFYLQTSKIIVRDAFVPHDSSVHFSRSQCNNNWGNIWFNYKISEPTGCRDIPLRILNKVCCYKALLCSNSDGEVRLPYNKIFVQGCPSQLVWCTSIFKFAKFILPRICYIQAN